MSEERPVVFDVAGDQCLGIVHLPDEPAGLGVVIIVGGPQYRAGSHRQFVQTARYLAAQGFPVFRFDYRGMGDSEGDTRGFDEIADDIGSALQIFAQAAKLEKFALFGLCDGASAAMIYASEDPRIVGLALLNPWVHSKEREAAVRLKTYYGARFLNPDFWKKVVSRQVAWRQSIGEFGSRLILATRSLIQPATSEAPALDFVARMQRSWTAFQGPTLAVLSGDDLVAEEFALLCRKDSAWLRLRSRKTTAVVRFSEADHTFSRAEHALQLDACVSEWLQGLIDISSMQIRTLPRRGLLQRLFLFS